jgi:hypothetical protein
LWKLNLRLATMKIVFVMCCATNLHKRKREKSNDKHIKLTKTTRGLERRRKNASENGHYDK